MPDRDRARSGDRARFVLRLQGLTAVSPQHVDVVCDEEALPAPVAEYQEIVSPPDLLATRRQDYGDVAAIARAKVEKIPAVVDAGDDSADGEVAAADAVVVIPARRVPGAAELNRDADADGIPADSGYGGLRHVPVSAAIGQVLRKH